MHHGQANFLSVREPICFIFSEYCCGFSSNVYANFVTVFPDSFSYFSIAYLIVLPKA